MLQARVLERTARSQTLAFPLGLQGKSSVSVGVSFFLFACAGSSLLRFRRLSSRREQGPELLLAVASPAAGRELRQLWDVGSEAWLLGSRGQAQ